MSDSMNTVSARNPSVCVPDYAFLILSEFSFSLQRNDGCRTTPGPGMPREDSRECTSVIGKMIAGILIVAERTQ